MFLLDVGYAIVPVELVSPRDIDISEGKVEINMSLPDNYLRTEIGIVAKENKINNTLWKNAVYCTLENNNHQLLGISNKKLDRTVDIKINGEIKDTVEQKKGTRMAVGQKVNPERTSICIPETLSHMTSST